MIIHATFRAARWITAVSVLAALACGGDAATAAGPTDPGTPGTPAPGDRVPSQYVGTWVSGNVSPVNFYSPSTGSWGAPSGVGMFYKFSTNGTYEKGLLLQSTLYNCTMSVFFYVRGTIRVDGTTFDLRSSMNKMKSVDNCVQKNNYEKTLETERETLLLRMGTDDYGNQTLFIRTPDSTPSRFYQRN